MKQIPIPDDLQLRNRLGIPEDGERLPVYLSSTKS